MAATNSAPVAIDPDAFGIRAHLPRLRDPGHASLRRAARAALLVPGVFALSTLLLPQPAFTTFATFGVFSLLVLGDFGGLSRPRATAYALSIAVGLPLIAFGTAASMTPWVAALTIGLGAFLLQFAGIFGGYVSAAQFPLLLCLVLSVAIQAPLDQLPLRCAGWLLGGAVALSGAVLLWPRHEQAVLRNAAADCCLAIAELFSALLARSADDKELEDRREAADQALAKLRKLYRDTPHRPVGPTRGARAFAELVDELGRVTKLLPSEDAFRHTKLHATDLLAESIVQVLEASGRALRDQGTRPDLPLLARRRGEFTEAANAWAAEQLRAGIAADQVLDGLQAERPLKVVSYAVLALGGNAILAAGRDLSEDAAAVVWRQVESERGVAAGARRIRQTVRTHLRLSGIWFRNSLRAAIGLSVAVLVVDLLGVDHAFWAVLGTLSVLRSNALATGRTGVAAIFGTTLGILPVSLLLIPLGTQPIALWAVFPPATFVAAYAPSVIGFVAGQAAFTLLVVVLFNLIQPIGWTLGLVRLEDVLIGSGLSLLVGVLLWPRGARGQLLSTFATLYRCEASWVHAAFGRLYGEASIHECDVARQRATEEAARAGEVFDQFLDDRAAKRLPPETWAALPSGGSHLLLAAEAIEGLAEPDKPAIVCDAGLRALSSSVSIVIEQLTLLSDSLQHEQAPPSSVDSATVPEDALRQATVECLRSWGGADDATQRTSAMRLVAAGDWEHMLSLLLDHLSGPAAAAVRVARTPWWR